jgi:hypothetical protein
MPQEIKYDRNHPAGGTPEARIASRLKNSGEGAKPNTTVQTGNSPNRVFHNIHIPGQTVGGTNKAENNR